MSDHTPGPWVFREFAQDEDAIAEMRELGMSPSLLLDNDGGAPIMAGSNRVAVVDMQKRSKRGEAFRTPCAERTANAQLIAASPELLEALERLLATYARLMPPGYPPSDEEKHAMAIIAKATGK